MNGVAERKLHLQVNRAFRDVIGASALTQHKIDLFSVGLEYNVAAGVSLADSKKALLQYRSSLDSLHPSEKRVVVGLQPSEDILKTAGGVAAVIGDSVHLFALGSPSRGIPYKEWRIPLPADGRGEWCFCPGADVIATLKVPEQMCVDRSQEPLKQVHFDITVTLSSNFI